MIRKRRSAKLIAMFMSLIMALTIFGVNTSVIFAEGDDSPGDTIANEEIINPEEQTEENESETIPEEEQMPEIEAVPGVEAQIQAEGDPEAVFENLPYTDGEVLYPGVTCRVGTWALNAPEGTNYTFDWNITFEKLEEGDDEPEYVLIDDPSEYVQWQEASEEDQPDNYSLMDFFAQENICPGRVGVQVDVYFDDETEPACSTTKEYIVTDAEPEFQLQLCPYTDAILGETKDLEVELFYDGEDVTKKSTFEWSFKYGHWVGDDETGYWEELENTGNKYFSDTAGATSNKHSVTVANSISEEELGAIDVGVTAYYKGEEVVVDPELGTIWVSNERYEISATFNGETTTRPYLMLGENNLTLTTKKYEVGKKPVVVPVTGNLQYQWLDDEWDPLPADGDITVTDSGSSYVVTKNTANGICFGVELVDTSLPEEEGWLTETDFYAMDNWPTICMVNSEGEYEAPDTDWDESFWINWYKPTNFQLVEDYDNGEFGNYTNLGVDWAVLVENDDGAGFVEDPDFANIVVDEIDSTKIQLTTKKDDDFYLAAFPEGTEEYTPDNAFYFMCMYSEGEETFKITSRTIKDDNLAVPKSILKVDPQSKIVLSVGAKLLDIEGPDPKRELSYMWAKRTWNWDSPELGPIDTIIEGKTENSYSFTAKDDTYGEYVCFVTDGIFNKQVDFYINNGYLNLYPTPAEDPEEASFSPVVIDPSQAETAKLKVDVSYTDELESEDSINYIWTKGSMEDMRTIDEGDIDPSDMKTVVELDQKDIDSVGIYNCTINVIKNGYVSEYDTVQFDVKMKQTITIKSPSDYDEDDDILVTLEMDENNKIIPQQAYVLAETSVPETTPSYNWFFFDDNTEEDLPSGTTCSLTKEGVYRCTVSDGYNEVEVQFRVDVNSGLTVEKKDYYYSFDLGDPELDNPFELKAAAKSSRGLPLTYKWYEETSTDSKLIEGVTGPTCKVTLGYKNYSCVVTDGFSTKNIWYEIDIDSGLTIEGEDSNDIYYNYNSGMEVPETSTFTVEATSDATDDLGYKWYKLNDDTEQYEPVQKEEASEKTGNTLTVANTTENSGCYVCLVNDGYSEEEVQFYLMITGIMLDGMTTDVELDAETYEYTGQEVEPKVTVTFEEKGLVPGTDYRVSYKDNVDVTDQAEVIVEGIGKYEGFIHTSFEITPADGEITTPPTAKTLAYTGETLELINAGEGTGDMWYKISEIMPDNEDTDWSKDIPTATDQGTYKVWYKLTGDENHTDVDVAADSYVEVTIGKAAATVTAPTKKTGLTYNESAMDLINAGSATGGTINYLVTDTTKTAPEGTWAEAIPTGTNAGDYRVWYKAIGDKNHSDSEPGYIDVTIAKATPAFPELDPLSGTCLQTLKDIALAKGFSWKDASEVLGTGKTKVATVIYTPADTDNYNTVSKDITITVIHEHSERVTNPAGYLRNGSDIEKCSDCGRVLINKQLPGYGTPNVKKFKVKKAKKSFTAKWKKAKKATLKLTSGYQIRYANNPGMNGAAYTYAGAKAKSKKVKGLAKKATYYVQMRAYYNTSTGPVYSSWTAVKKVTTK